MRLYRVNNFATKSIVWAGTEADAKTLARDENCARTKVEVPTDKDGLLEWLNKNVSVDNIEPTVEELRASGLAKLTVAEKLALSLE